jgi:alpha-L-fucosidase 2
MLVQSDDGVIFVLPALPDIWKDGSIKGLRTRGGFEIENMEWKNGIISKLVIKSTLGGNCRIRSYSPLKAEDNAILVQAKGKNNNPFYQVADVKKPLVSPKAKQKTVELNKSYLYDIETKPGRIYIISEKI